MELSTHARVATLVLLATLATLSCVTSLPTRPCAPLTHEEGMEVLNCSGRGYFHMPEHLSDEVEVLDFADNRFTELPSIPESRECHVNVEHRHCDVITSANHCRVRLVFRSNEIERLPSESLSNLSCVRDLDLSWNRLTGGVLTSTTFMEGYHNLWQLNLSHNPLATLPGNSLSSAWMPDLRDLDLSYCQLTDLDPNAVDDHGELRRLDLSHNKLASLHPNTFKGLARLQVLDLRFNKLSYFPEKVFGDLYSLHSLGLAHNALTAGYSFHRRAFYRDTKLSDLDLSYNDLEDIPYEAVDRLPQLVTLNLSHNPITRVSASLGPTNYALHHLIMNTLGQLTTLDAGALNSFPRLTSLVITNCKRLSSVHPLAIGINKTTLRHVDLSNNAIRTLAQDALPWRQLETLDLHGNAWRCDVGIAWVIKAAAKLETDDVICAEPLKLRGQSIFTVNPSDLSRPHDPSGMVLVVVAALLVPVVGGGGYLLYRRRQHCTCVTAKVRGRYVSVFTRDMDAGDEEGEVNIELKVNVNTLRTVSNGASDDTKHLMTYEDRGEDEEEEI